MSFAGRDLSVVAPHRGPTWASAGCRRSATSSLSLTVEENLTVVATKGPWDLAKRVRHVPAPAGTPR
jgi:hypothetical protein